MAASGRPPPPPPDDSPALVISGSIILILLELCFVRSLVRLFPCGCGWMKEHAVETVSCRSTISAGFYRALVLYDR
jgi:hypothetical protein